jgi:hypothetical protein
MREHIRRFTPYIVTAVLVWTAAAVGPPLASAAFDAVNARKVDGLSAVKASATIKHRAGKLVATDKKGRLPDNIIRGFVHVDQRFAIMYPLPGGTAVGYMAIRGDASVREASDPTAAVERVGPGKYCITAPHSREGAVGSLQNQGGDGGGTIRVSMGIGSFCNNVTGSNITVETYRRAPRR